MSRRLLIPLLVAAALLAAPAASQAQAVTTPLNLFAVKNLQRCLSSAGLDAGKAATCVDNFRYDVVYHVYTCYRATQRALADANGNELEACLAAQERRAAASRSSSRRR